MKRKILTLSLGLSPFLMAAMPKVDPLPYPKLDQYCESKTEVLQKCFFQSQNFEIPEGFATEDQELLFSSTAELEGPKNKVGVLLKVRFDGEKL